MLETRSVSETRPLIVKMTERYAEFASRHIAKTGNTAREMWKFMQKESKAKAGAAC
jgi:hypothetical protein